MSNILISLQGDKNGKLLKTSRSALSAAIEIKNVHGLGSILGVVLGQNAKAIADDAATYGFDEVLFSENPVFEKFVASTYANALDKAFSSKDVSVVIAAATSSGKDILPVLCAKHELAQASDVIAVNDDKSFQRPIYAGNVIASVELLTEKFAVSVRASSFAAAESAGNNASVSELSEIPEADARIEVLGYEFAEQDRPDLASAEVVVSGGRAVGSEENFEKVIYPFADSLGAAVGASRAAVDSGYAPNDWQVGQTGKIVAPKLYFAVGLSGAIQHLAGMKDSGTIVAINTDAEAPIFEVADFGLVADLFTVLPELTEKISSLK